MVAPFISLTSDMMYYINAVWHQCEVREGLLFGVVTITTTDLWTFLVCFLSSFVLLHIL